MRERPSFHQETIDNGSINNSLDQKKDRNNPNDKPVDPNDVSFKKITNRLIVGAAILGAVGLYQVDKQNKALGIDGQAPQKQGELKKDNKPEQNLPPIIIPETTEPLKTAPDDNSPYSDGVGKNIDLVQKKDKEIKI